MLYSLSGPKAFRLILEREADPLAAPPVVEAAPPTDGNVESIHQFKQNIDDHRVDEPDAKAFRLIVERELRPLAVPPVVKSALESTECGVVINGSTADSRD